LALAIRRLLFRRSRILFCNEFTTRAERFQVSSCGNTGSSDSIPAVLPLRPARTAPSGSPSGLRGCEPVPRLPKFVAFHCLVPV